MYGRIGGVRPLFEPARWETECRTFQVRCRASAGSFSASPTTADRLGHCQGRTRGRAEIALTYQGDALKKRVEPLAAELGGLVLGHCDVTDPATIDAVFDVLKEKWGKIDFVVHAIAFADKDQLDGRYIETTAENFSKSMLISCYSLTAIAQRAEKLMTDGGSIITLTYYGAEKWMPHYNVMGVAKAALEASVRYLAADLGEKNIRVNAISAGPIKTLAASGIGDFRYILKWNEYNAPLRRNVTTDEVGDSARVSALRPRARRDRRGASRRCRLQRAGHEASGRAGHFAWQGLAVSRNARADDLLHPPRRNGMECAGPAAGHAGHSAQRAGAGAGDPGRQYPRRARRARRA